MNTQLLREAAAEIRHLRRQNEILSAKAEVIETIGLSPVDAQGIKGRQ